MDDLETNNFALRATPINSFQISRNEAKFWHVLFSHPLLVKLDSRNFLLWRQQTLSTIQGHRLGEYILNLSSVPQKF